MTVFYLKLAALVTMLIDHVGLVFQYDLDTNALRVIGRVSFPIFAFLIAEGARHTRSMEKYLLRLLCFAFISEIPFDMVLSNVLISNKGFPVLFDLAHQNVFFTLFIGAAAIYVYERIGKLQGFLVAVLILLTATPLNTDFGTSGTVLIFAVYLAKETNVRFAPLLPLAMFGLYKYGFNAIYAGSALVAVVLVALYNGKKGIGLKWLFYLAYPVHMIILYGIWFIL